MVAADDRQRDDTIMLLTKWALLPPIRPVVERRERFKVDNILYVFGGSI